MILEVIAVTIVIGLVLGIGIPASLDLQFWVFERFTEDSELQEKILHRIGICVTVIVTTAMLFAPMPIEFLDYSGGPGRFILIATMRAVVGVLIGAFIGYLGLGAILFALIMGAGGTVLYFAVQLIMWIWEH